MLCAILTVPQPIEQTNCRADHRNHTQSCHDKDCYHGYCKETILDTEVANITYGECICDPGWKGKER